MLQIAAARAALLLFLFYASTNLVESLLEKLTNDKVQADVGLRDWPIATGSAPLYLDSLPWTWSGQGHLYFQQGARLPISDLFNAGIIE